MSHAPDPPLMRIDLHTHIVPERWGDFADRYGSGRWRRLVHRDPCRATIMTGDAAFREVDDRSCRPARRIEDMDRLGIDRQALSPPPIMFCYWAEGRAGQAFARVQNDNVAEVVARHPRRFVGIATVPLQDTAVPPSCGPGIETILGSSSLARQMGEYGRAKMARKFSAATCAAALIDAYRVALADPRRA